MQVIAPLSFDFFDETTWEVALKEIHSKTSVIESIF